MGILCRCLRRPRAAPGVDVTPFSRQFVSTALAKRMQLINRAGLSAKACARKLFCPPNGIVIPGSSPGMTTIMRAMGRTRAQLRLTYIASIDPDPFTDRFTLVGDPA